VESIRNGYNSHQYYESNEELKEAIDQLREGFFSPEEPGLFADLANNLMYHDQ